jgi:hypothetical protein
MSIVVKFNPIQRLFIDAILDLIGKDIAYDPAGKFYCDLPMESLRYCHLVALMCLSIEQDHVIVFSKFPPLTSDLTVKIDSVILDGDNLFLLISKKTNVKSIKPAKQVRATRSKLKNIYPYSEFDLQHVVVEYV